MLVSHCMHIRFNSRLKPSKIREKSHAKQQEIHAKQAVTRAVQASEPESFQELPAI